MEQIRLKQLEEEKQAKHDTSDKEHVIVENPGDLSGSTKFLWSPGALSDVKSQSTRAL